jgi:hypothetical protein
MNDEAQNENAPAATLKPYTVSAVYDDGLESLIVHCMAADAQAARDQLIMKTGGAVVIASVFDGHLSEPDAVVFQVSQDSKTCEEDAVGSAGERP